MNLETINARIAEIGRPMLTDLRHAIDLRRMSELRTQQLAWDACNVALAAERRALVEQAHELQAAEENAAVSNAGRVRELERIKKFAGAKIHANIQAPRDEPAMDAAKMWLGGSEWCLSLIGSIGRGKTFAAAWAALNGNLGSWEWLFAPEAASRPLYGPIAQANLSEATSCGLLVIDDYGAELANDGWKSWVGSVLGVRYSRGLRTVITSNLDAAGFAARLEARLTDRVREGRVFESSGKSMRTRGGR